jgi:hypothetical protein
MRFIVCLTGLPQEAVQEIQKHPSVEFTETRDTPVIAKAIREPFAYRVGMSDYYLNEIAARIDASLPSNEVAIAVAYVDYGASAVEFLQDFFPFASVARIPPFYPNAFDACRRRHELLAFVESVREITANLRKRIRIVRDVLSGQNFSPLTLPIGNFRSDVLVDAIHRIFVSTVDGEELRAMIKREIQAIEDRHPLERMLDKRSQPYFSDDRSLRFRSPGKDRHGFMRDLLKGHRAACLINSRARLGAPLDGLFHYDCDYSSKNLDDSYPNCHGADAKPGKTTHVNIAPSDAIR